MLLDKQDSLRLSTGVYEPVETALIKYLLKPDWICLDIGAHIGYYTIMMAKLCRMVYAFEPEIKNYELLRENTKRLKNVELWNVAIAEAAEVSKLYLCNTNSGMHRLYPSKWCVDTQQIITMRLDASIRDVNFIKMDCEGSEFGALKGMRLMLTVDRPIMIMEFHPPSIEEYGASPEEEYHFLKTLGYSIRLIPKISIPISFQDLEKETRKESGRNVLCIPNGEKLF